MTKAPVVLSLWSVTLLVSLALLLQACGDGNPTPPTAVAPAPELVATPLGVVTHANGAWSTSRRLMEKPPSDEVVISGPGQLVSATRINTVAAADITAAVQGHDKMPSALPVYAVTSYRLTYVTQDGYGNDIVASGLVSVPVKESDFIYTAISEHMGFIGTTAVIILSFLFLMRCLYVASHATQKAYSFTIIGLTAGFAFHFIENMGMCVGLLPITGIPLPFISLGGSAILVNFISLGIILSISMERNLGHQ